MDVCKVCGLAPDPNDPSKHSSCIDAYRASMAGAAELQTIGTLCSIDLTSETPHVPRPSPDARPLRPADDHLRLRPEADDPFKVPIA